MATVTIDPNVAKEDRRRARMGALAVTLTKTDRILTGRDDVTCAFYMGDSPSMDAPAWNDGKRITIWADRLPSIESASGLVTTLGLNHHEVSHILFSLGSQTPFIQLVAGRGHFDAYNLLEDMRIERLFSDLYISAKKYLTAPVLHFIVENENLWPTAHLLTYGRRYLPLEIRKEMRKRFIGSASLRRDAESIIDEFRMMDLSDVTLHNRAAELVKKFHDLLEQLKPKLDNDQQQALEAHKGCKGVKEFTNDRAKVAKAAKDAGRRLGEDEEDEDEDPDFDEDTEDEPWDPGNMDDDSEDDGDSDASDGQDSRGNDPEDGDDEGSSGPGNSGEDDEDDPNQAGGSGRGDGSSQGGDGDEEDGDGLDVDGDTPGSLGAPGGGSGEEVENLIQAILEELENEEEVQDEITRLQNSMDNLENMDAVLPDDKYRDKAPSAEAGSASQAVIREFQVLATPFEAGWEYGADTGRVNAQRAMTAEFGDMDFFDNWDEGREADAALEVVVLVDKSGSMSSDMASASEAAWVVKRGIDEVDGKSTMLTFGKETYRLYKRSERADPSKVRHSNNLEMDTLPDNGMREARMILNQSDRPNRLLVVITDGGFSRSRYTYDATTGQSGYESIEYKSLLESIDATRVYIGIRTESDSALRPCYDVHQKISKPEEIPAIIKAAVASMLNDAYKRR